MWRWWIASLSTWRPRWFFLCLSGLSPWKTARVSSHSIHLKRSMLNSYCQDEASTAAASASCPQDLDILSLALATHPFIQRVLKQYWSLVTSFHGPNEKGMLSAWGLVDVLPNCITLPCCSGPMISLNPIDHSINLMCAITLSSIKVTCVWNPLNSCGWEGQHFPPQHEHNELRQVP